MNGYKYFSCVDDVNNEDCVAVDHNIRDEMTT